MSTPSEAQVPAAPLPPSAVAAAPATGVAAEAVAEAAAEPAAAAAPAAAPVATSEGEAAVAPNESPAAAAPAPAAVAVAPPTVPSAEGQSASYKLFVGQLPHEVQEDEFRAVFAPFGEISDLVILKDRMTGMSKGCGFVTYTSRQAADAAIEATNNIVQMGARTLQTSYANKPGQKRGGAVVPGGLQPDEHGNYKLFVGMLDLQSTEESVTALFSTYGEVKEVFIMKNPQGGSKGCCFVKYTDPQAAENAIAALNDRYTDGGAPRPLQVRMAETKAQRAQKQMQQGYGMGGMGMGGYNPAMMQQMMAVNPMMAQQMYYQQQQMWMQQQQQPGMWGGAAAAQAPRQSYARGGAGCNLFVYGIPETFQDSDLQGMFEPFGTVVSASVYRDRHTGMSKGFGFVSYDNPQTAQMAIQSLNGFMIGQKRLKVELKSQRGGGASGGSYAHHYSAAAPYGAAAQGTGGGQHGYSPY